MLSTNKFFISCKESRIENNRSFYGCFYLGPFDSAQSLTIANALRRTLLSELSGVAITSVQIEGVLHEYSNIPGMKESVLDVLLNLKEIVFKKTFLTNNRTRISQVANAEHLELDKTQNVFHEIGYLKARGPGVIKACDLKLPPSIQCVDPEQYIATLCEDGILNLKFSISEGKNYIIQTPQKLNLQNKFKKRLDLQELKKRSSLLKKIQKSTSAVSTDLNTSQGGKSSVLDIFNKGNLNLNSNASSAVLPIDAVFMPIYKVNYVLESNDQSYDNFIPGIPSQTNLNLRPNNEISTSFGATNRAQSPINAAVEVRSLNKAVSTLKTKQTSNLSHFAFSKIKSAPSETNNTNEIQPNEQSSSQITANTLNLPHNLNKKHNIILEVWTNGSIHPRQAVYEALKNLLDVFIKLQKAQTFKSMFKSPKTYQQIFKDIAFKPPMQNSLANNTDLTKKPLGRSDTKQVKNRLGTSRLKLKQNLTLELMDIGSLNISLRPYTCLKRSNINTIGDLLKYTKKDLLDLKNFGKRSLEEVEKSLEFIGLQLNEN